MNNPQNPNQSFQQFAASAPAFGPPTGPAPAVPQNQAPQWAPPQGPPAGAPPAQAPAWGPPAAPPAQQPAPQQAWAPQGQQGYGAPAGQYASQQPAPPAPGSLLFGAGAFAGATPMTDKKDCADGDYVFEIVRTEQALTKLRKRGFRTTLKVVHVHAGSQPVGSEVTDWENMGDDMQAQYAAAAMLAIAMAAFQCTTPEQLKGGLQGMYPQCQNAWSDFSDAMQLPTQQVNPVPPNPLAGKFIRARVTSSPNNKKPGEFYKNFAFTIAS